MAGAVRPAAGKASGLVGDIAGGDTAGCAMLMWSEWIQEGAEGRNEDVVEQCATGTLLCTPGYALSRDAPLASENGNLPLLSVSASGQLSVVGVVCGRRVRLSSPDLTSTDTCRADIRL